MAKCRTRHAYGLGRVAVCYAKAEEEMAGEGEDLDINTSEVDESMVKEGEGAVEEQDVVCIF